MNKKLSFFIQFNKAIFTPGDLLQFRVFAVDSETKAISPKCTSAITITDPNDNSIQSFEDVTFSRGKYENSFQLSEKAGLGIWKISARCDQEVETKVFEVAEYILPLLDGKLTVPSITPVTNGKIPITVDITYTSGGEASGPATVSISKNGPDILQKTVQIESGTATIELDIVNDLKLPAGLSGSFGASVVFEDALTGNKVVDSKNFEVTRYTYTISSRTESIAKPGSPLTFTITMQKYDGSPAPAGTQVTIEANVPDNIPSQTLTIGDDGTVTSSVDIPSNTTYFNMKIKAEEADGRNLYARIISSGTQRGPFIQIDVLTPEPKINERLQIHVTTGEQVLSVMLHIMSKSVLLDSIKLNFDSDSDEDNDKTTVIYTMKPSFKYAPEIQFFAYYITKSGDFVIGQTRVRLQNDLPNYLKISPSTQDVKPGEEISLDIESKIGSKVSLLAMDQRVLLLRTGHNFTKEEVIRDLNKYNLNNIRYESRVAGYEYDFGDAGLFVFTNIPRPYRSVPRRRQAMSRPRGSKPGSRELKVREDFRETFLWRDVSIYDSANDYDDESKGIATITEKVPESITTYLIYGVSMSKYDGIGLSDNIPEVSIFLPFFLSIELPYSVKRNEVLIQDILIFNYLPRRQTVEVKITKNDGFEAVELENYGWKDVKGFYVKSIKTYVNKNIKLQFALKSDIIGFIPFEVTAKGPLAGDGIKKQLRIIPEGISRSITSSVFIALDSKNPEEKATLTCTFPKSAYMDTTSVSATVAGDVFGKALINLDKLIKMPSGCGEQTMLSLAPDIAIYEYLSVSEKLTGTLQGTLQNYIRAGYQNEMRYQRRDGSFSAFGDYDKSGSTWLTAYVVQYFYFAKNIITIDPNVLKGGADFIVRNQNADGSFKEPGRVFHTDMQGGSGAGIGLTAYCTIVLSILMPDYLDFVTARDKAVKYLEDNYSTGRTLYELGIISNALQIAKSSKASSAYNMFYAKKTEADGLLYWTTPAPANPDYWYRNQPRSLDIEVTSYGLLTVIKKGEKLATILKIVKYLVSKANNLGGYSSSQDTVMAFYALSQFARTYALDANVELTMTPNVGNKFEASVDSSNAFTLQSFELKPSTTKLKIVTTTDDSGIAIVSLICNFYEDPTKVVPTFNVTYNYGFTCNSRMTLNVCASYIPKGTSNMAIMIVNMPSGFVYNDRQGQRNQDISRTEVVNQGSQVIFYFNSFSNAESCVTINAFRAKIVAELKGATIEVYDYYDTSKQGMTSYPPPDMTEKCYYYEYDGE
ncbi:hypothetical protein ACKWTF_005838 [Chironomus riparius]